ncbi:MAG: helix-turn-helix domain-containing protein [Candidatus Berkelbacteria bacterium]
MQIEIEIFSQNLRNLREEREMTQENLAQLLGVSRQSIIALERGKCLPSLPLAIHFAEVFNLALEDIVRPNEEPVLLDEPDLAESLNEMRERESDWLVQIKLPENIDKDNIEAEVQNGNLIITIPKVLPEQPKLTKIKVINKK